MMKNTSVKFVTSKKFPTYVPVIHTIIGNRAKNISFLFLFYYSNKLRMKLIMKVQFKTNDKEKDNNNVDCTEFYINKHVKFLQEDTFFFSLSLSLLAV